MCAQHHDLTSLHSNGHLSNVKTCSQSADREGVILFFSLHYELKEISVDIFFVDWMWASG